MCCEAQHQIQPVLYLLVLEYKNVHEDRMTLISIVIYTNQGYSYNGSH